MKVALALCGVTHGLYRLRFNQTQDKTPKNTPDWEATNMSPFADRLIHQALENQSQVVVGLDPDITRFPAYLQARLKAEPTEQQLEEIIVMFNSLVIEATASLVAAYKPQAAFYEQYGLAGLKALQRTIGLLREQKLLTILDGKRNDVSHTAGAYATAWLAPQHPVFENTANPWQADAITLNGYLGSDGVQPFIKCNQNAGLFILCKTSNASSGELQDLTLQEGSTVAEKMATLSHQWGQNNIGQQGYSNIGMVVGATYPKEAAIMRQKAPQALFLMPGIGAQGGSLDAIVAAAGKQGIAAYASSSRGILYPFQAETLTTADWAETARQQIQQTTQTLQKAIQDKLK